MKIHRQLYDWVLGWAGRPGGEYALFALAFVESSFFPIPPDVLQVALAIGRPERSLRYAAITSVGSVLGGAFGYLIGYTLYEALGHRIITFYELGSLFEKVGGYYASGAFWWILVAAFTPIPYKVFTIAAGVYHQFVPFWVLIAASAVGRPARFFLVGSLIYHYGEDVRGFIDRRFDIVTVGVAALIVGGFATIAAIGH